MLTEDAVIEALREHLAADGWQITAGHRELTFGSARSDSLESAEHGCYGVHHRPRRNYEAS